MGRRKLIRKSDGGTVLVVIVLGMVVMAWRACFGETPQVRGAPVYPGSTAAPQSAPVEQHPVQTRVGATHHPVHHARSHYGRDSGPSVEALVEPERTAPVIAPVYEPTYVPSEPSYGRVNVRGYYRRNGTYVNGYSRRR